MGISEEQLIDRLILSAQLIGTIAAHYGIPLAEINEIEEGLKRDNKIKDMIEAENQKAAKKKFDKLPIGRHSLTIVK